MKVLILTDSQKKQKDIREIVAAMGEMVISYTYENTFAISMLESDYRKQEPYDLVIVDSSFMILRDNEVIKSVEDFLIRVHQRRIDVPIIIFSTKETNYNVDFFNVRAEILYASQTELKTKLETVLKMFESPIQKELKAAGQYEAVKKILTNITEELITQYPLYAFTDENGQTKWHTVDGVLVRTEAENLLAFLEGKRTTEGLKLSHLYQRVDDAVNTKLNNYALRISHRMKLVEHMDEIHPWQVLRYLIEFLEISDRRNAWVIPEEWRV